jgi:probable HAF family extracellular repeat protein
MKVALTGGAYQARSVIASAQRQLNLFSEPMPEAQGEPGRAANYPTPGTRLLSTIGTGPIRGIRQATTGGIYVVSGSTVYSVNPTTWAGTSLGTITAGLRTPVSMVDNGLDMLIVDGTANGWDINLAANTMSQIVDPTGMFSGADKVDYLDTFFILNKPNTPQFYISGSLAVTFDPLDFANKEAYSDLLVTLIVARREIYLLGAKTTEVWYDVGAQNPTDTSFFQFASVQGVFIDHGCVAKYSPATYDNGVFWLTADRQGHGIVMTSAGYQTKRISTYAIEAEIAGYARIDDAIGFCYQLAGHTFYVLTFPHADHTWVYDITTGLWHEWLWIDSNGSEHRHRANCFWPVNDTLVVGDWQNGNLYALDQNVFTDVGWVSAPAPAGYIGPLDIVAGAVLAYSQRALSAAWSSDAITIRRDSDDTSMSFATNVTNAIDPAAVGTFIGGGAGFVTKLFDQSGHGADALEATAVNQPQWGASLIGGKPGLIGDRINSVMETAVNVTIATGAITAFAVVQSSDDSVGQGVFYLSVDVDSPYVQMALLRTDTPPYLRLYLDAFNDPNEIGTQTDAVASVDTPYLFVGAWQSGTSKTLLNGADVPNVPFDSGGALDTITGPISILTQSPGVPVGGFLGYLSELLIYDGLLSDVDILSISQNIAAYYGISTRGTGGVSPRSGTVVVNTPIKRVRSFPHMLNDGKRVFYRQFLADMETGNAPQETVVIPPVAAGFTALPLATGGSFGGAYAVSADGSTVVGYVAPAGTIVPGDHHKACYWSSPTSDPTIIGPDFSEAYGVSGDGSVIVGDTFTKPFIWTAGGGYVLFGSDTDAVWGISSDGTRLVGATSADGGTHYQACYWNRSFARTDLGTLPGHDDATALAVSADGTCIVGYSRIRATASSQRAFRWTASGGMVDLGVAGSADHSTGTGVSDDGTVVSVNQTATPDPNDSAAKWTLAGGLELLPALPGAVSDNFAIAVSGDGSMIVGVADEVVGGIGTNSENLAWWTPVTGATAITVTVPSADPLLSALIDAKGVSRDGMVIVGTTHGGDSLPWVYHRAGSPGSVAITSVNLISLDWSDDRGHSYGNPVSQSMGEAGEYRTSLQWQRLGVARDRVFRLTWSVAAPTALQGAWIDPTPAES